MRALARIAAEARRDGGTRLTTLAGQAPLLLRQTSTEQDPPAGPGSARETGAAQVYLVGGAAGPLGGDELRYTVELGPGADVRVRSAAASLVLPGPHEGESTLDITARVGDGARLSWSPQPMIVARGARHRTTVHLDLAASARLIWREEILLGRHGEPPGSVAARLRVRREGRVLLDHTLAAGPRYPGSLDAAVTAGDTAIGTLVIVDPDWARVPPADRLPLPTRDDVGGALAVMPLPGPAVVVSALAPDGLTLRRLLEPGRAWRLTDYEY
ncbi:MAG TPA: urease accessory protein UreD [Actinocrinis sp.]|nr:urease accessory protein UreD [Actinocrinis sp.]